MSIAGRVDFERRVRRWRRCCISCSLLLALFAVRRESHAATILIDDFAQPNAAHFFSLGSGNSPFMQMSQTVGGVIGGQRDSLFQVMGQAQPNSTVGLLGHDTSYNIDALQVGTNGFSPTIATLQYSGTNDLNTPTSLVNAHGLGGGLGIDLTDGGANDRFELQFFTSDALPTTGLGIAVTITSPGGKSSTATAVAPNAQAFFTFDIPFGQLVGNALLSNVDSITFVFNGAAPQTPNIDYELHQLAAVPEPASGLLMTIATGAWGWLALRSRRRRISRFTARRPV
jgi:hypothetical protein